MSQKKIYFISGIDTGCGKTHITGQLAKAMMNAGLSVITQKLVQTGSKDISEDIAEHRRIMGVNFFPEDNAGLTCPYIFSFPASPHLAARIENKTIHTEVLTDATKKLAKQYDIVLIEGAGGLHVPLTEGILTIDYIQRQKYPLILVSSSKLGSINHTLLSIESCALHKIDLKAIVYNRFPDDNNTIADETYNIIQKNLKKFYPNATIYNSDNEIINLVNKL